MHFEFRVNNLRYAELKLGIFINPMYDRPDVSSDDFDTEPIAHMIELGFLVFTIGIII